MVLLLIFTLVTLCSSAVVRQAIPAGSVGRLGRCSVQWHCSAGLTCVHGECLELVREGDECGAVWQSCGSNTKVQCLGVSGDRRCRTLVGLGSACGTPWRVCAGNLTCRGVGYTAACYQMVKTGARCDRPFRVCPNNHICRMNSHGNTICTIAPSPSTAAAPPSTAAPPPTAVTPPPLTEPSPWVLASSPSTTVTLYKTQATPKAVLPSPTVTPVTEMPEASAMPELVIPEPSGYVLAASGAGMRNVWTQYSSQPSESPFASLPPMPSISCLPCPTCMTRAAGCDCVTNSGYSCVV